MKEFEIIRSRAPLRIGLAGGGTDVSPYSDLYGGSILNATISLYAYATIELVDDNNISFHAVDREEFEEYPLQKELPINGKLDLLKGVYNHMVKHYNVAPRALKLSTYADVPSGSGLGTSSTLVVAIVGAFAEFYNLPFGEYEIARIAYDIERVDLGQAGGKQDQYAATFGGVNFMEFKKDNTVLVNPLRVKDKYLNELEFNLLLYYTDTSRFSSDIIEKQADNVKQKKAKSIDAMHKLKEQSVRMKEAILKGELDKIGEILDFGWQQKKQMAVGISNPVIDGIYDAAIKAGATGGKISGAGGGGFMIFYCPKNTRYAVRKALTTIGGIEKKFQFTDKGQRSWTI